MRLELGQELLLEVRDRASRRRRAGAALKSLKRFLKKPRYLLNAGTSFFKNLLKSFKLSRR
jgi:hypothetical protein